MPAHWMTDWRRPVVGAQGHLEGTAAASLPWSDHCASIGLTMLGGRSSDQWVAEYSQSHQHPINRACHTLGIPLIVASLALAVVAWFVEGFWPVPTALFVVGWALQFVGHAFEGKPPEFFKDPRFLLIGLRWWFAKLRGKA